MRTTYYANRRGGHCPGHVRDTFLEAVEAFRDWADGEPEPTVEFEVNYEPRAITLSKACGLVWNCSDILPRDALSNLELCDVDIPRQTYASAARAMAAEIERLTAA